MSPQDEYYHSHRQLPFIGSDGQARLSNAKVLVVGAGGLGCPCLTSLAGAGVGTLGIAEGDRVTSGNLHRQPLYSYEDVGNPKATSASERLRQHNPFINIQIHNDWVTADTAASIISEYDIVADCTDNFNTRYLLNDTCVQLDKPLVYGAIHQGEGQLTVFNFQGGPTLRCLFPNSAKACIKSCSEIGAYAITTAVIGHLMANEIIKIITGHPTICSGQLLQLNIIDGSQQSFAFSRTAAGFSQSMNADNNLSLIRTPELLKAQFESGQAPLLIDIREEAERRKGHLGGMHLPLQQLLQQSSFPFQTNDELIVYCQRGQRSVSAVKYLHSLGYQQTFHLAGGVQAMQNRFPQLIISGENVP